MDLYKYYLFIYKKLVMENLINKNELAYQPTSHPVSSFKNSFYSSRTMELELTRLLRTNDLDQILIFFKEMPVHSQFEIRVNYITHSIYKAAASDFIVSITVDKW